MSVYLNKEHPEPAYQCGRLLAMLASLQYSALGDVGAGVADLIGEVFPAAAVA